MERGAGAFPLPVFMKKRIIAIVLALSILFVSVPVYAAEVYHYQIFFGEYNSKPYMYKNNKNGNFYRITDGSGNNVYFYITYVAGRYSASGFNYSGGSSTYWTYVRSSLPTYATLYSESSGNYRYDGDIVKSLGSTNETLTILTGTSFSTTGTTGKVINAVERYLNGENYDITLFRPFEQIPDYVGDAYYDAMGILSPIFAGLKDYLYSRIRFKIPVRNLTGGWDRVEFKLRYGLESADPNNSGFYTGSLMWEINELDTSLPEVGPIDVIKNLQDGTITLSTPGSDGNHGGGASFGTFTDQNGQNVTSNNYDIMMRPVRYDSETNNYYYGQWTTVNNVTDNSIGQQIVNNYSTETVDNSTYTTNLDYSTSQVFDYSTNFNGGQFGDNITYNEINNYYSYTTIVPDTGTVGGGNTIINNNRYYNTVKLDLGEPDEDSIWRKIDFARLLGNVAAMVEALLLIIPAIFGFFDWMPTWAKSLALTSFLTMFVFVIFKLVWRFFRDDSGN